jgi:hypothetical protein
MSLIDEALKRARQEAARQDEAAREQRYRQVPVIPGLRPRPRRNWLLPVVIVACLLAGLGLGLALSSRGGDDQRAAVPPPAAPPPSPSAIPSPQPTQAAAAPEPAEEKPAPPVVVEEKPAPPPAPEPAAPPARPAPAEEPAIADMRQREIELRPAREPEPTAPAPAPVAQAPAPVPSPETTAPAPAAPAAATGQVRTYQQEMPLAGGGTLRLNGIAYSEQPVALFGDKVVAPGESVAGYKVVAIEAKRVRLEGQGGVVVLEMP